MVVERRGGSLMNEGAARARQRLEEKLGSFRNFRHNRVQTNEEELCKDIECGKGTCKPSGNLTFLYDCECHPGWKQPAGLSFLPCVIPNCSIDFSCAPASSPARDKESRASQSIFDPCEWIDCGGGTCNKTSFLTYDCECIENYHNLLNISAFPCYHECALGMDCKNLGFSFTNTSASFPPTVADTTNEANSVPGGPIVWLIIHTTIFVLFC